MSAHTEHLIVKSREVLVIIGKTAETGMVTNTSLSQFIQVRGPVLIYINSQVLNVPKGHASGADYWIKDEIYASQINAFLAGGLLLYRGIPRWHATWHMVTNNQPLTPLGTGEVPDFSTENCAYIPFTCTRDVALGAAISQSGMGAKDKLAMVNGYSKADDFPIGLVLEAKVTPKTHKLGFFNAREVQVKGPIPPQDYRVNSMIKMGTRQNEVFKGKNIPDTDKFAPLMPELPTDEEKRVYLAEHKQLLK